LWFRDKSVTGMRSLMTADYSMMMMMMIMVINNNNNNNNNNNSKSHETEM